MQCWGLREDQGQHLPPTLPSNQPMVWGNPILINFEAETMLLFFLSRWTHDPLHCPLPHPLNWPKLASRLFSPCNWSPQLMIFLRRFGQFPTLLPSWTGHILPAGCFLPTIELTWNWPGQFRRCILPTDSRDVANWSGLAGICHMVECVLKVQIV